MFLLVPLAEGSITLNLPQMGIGGVIAFILLTLARLAGEKLKASTVIATKNIEDKSKLRIDLMAQVDSLWTRIGEHTREISYLRERDAVFMRTFANLGGEVRLLNGNLALHYLELKVETLDRNELQLQCRSMQDTLQRMTEVIKEGHDEIGYINSKYGITKIPSREDMNSSMRVDNENQGKKTE